MADKGMESSEEGRGSMEVEVRGTKIVGWVWRIRRRVVRSGNVLGNVMGGIAEK